MYSGRLRDPARRATRETPALWAGLRTGPLALTEGRQNCAGAETFGRGSWRGPETPPQRGGDLRSRIVAGSGDPATTGRRPSVADRGGVRGPRHNGAVADRGGVRRPRHNESGGHATTARLGLALCAARLCRRDSCLRRDRVYNALWLEGQPSLPEM